MARISAIHQTASTTSAAALYDTIGGWLSSCNRATNGEEIGVICDDTTYDENITISTAVSGTNAVRLTANDGVLVTTIDGGAAPNVRGTGPFRDGAGMDSSAGGELITITVNYVIIDHLSLVQRDTTTGISTIKLSGARTECGILYNTLEATAAATDSDGIYVAGNVAYTKLLIAGNAFFGHSRAAIMREQPDVSGTHSSTWGLEVIHNGGYSDRDNDPLAGLVFFSMNSTGDTDVCEIHNNAGGFYENGGTRVTSFGAGTTTRGDPAGTMTWNGRNNFEDGAGLADLDDVDNTTGWVSGSANPSTVATTQTSGTYWVVNNLTAGTADLRPLDTAAGNKIIRAGCPTVQIPARTAFLDGYYDPGVDLRGYRYDPHAPDIGPFSFADHPQVPFRTQGQHI